MQRHSLTIQLATKTTRILIFCLIFMGCQGNSKEVVYELINGSDRSLKGAIVEIEDPAILKNYQFSAELVDEENNQIQYVDEDKDGTWDRLLLKLDFEPGEKKLMRLTAANTPTNSGALDVNNITFSVKGEGRYTGLEIEKMVRSRGANQSIKDPFFHLEGPGIENDKVAFRTFFDPRNGKDIYGKTTDQPALQRAGIDSSWHKLSDWGMDILHVGKSLGAGGLAVLQGDELHRLGDADQSIFRKLYMGPLESAYRIDFMGWDAGNQKIDGFEQISLKQGKHYYCNKIGLSDTSIELVVGMPNFKSDTVFYTRHNEDFASIWSYANQADGTDTRLGMAIMFQANQYTGHDMIKNGEQVSNTSYVTLRSKPINQIYFFACWELSDPSFSSQENFEKYLQNEADMFSNKIEIIQK